MRPKNSGLILLILTAVSCGGRQDKMQRDQQNYDVVQEGSTSGNTTNLNAPGETAAPMTTSATTATNVDTTTAFTLPGTATTTSTAPPGTIAGSLPTNSTGSIYGYTPPRQPPRPRVERPTQPPMNSSTSTAPPAQTEGPPATETVAPPTTTDTTGTSSPPKKDKNKDKNQQQQPPPTDTSTPPTTTSTQSL